MEVKNVNVLLYFIMMEIINIVSMKEVYVPHRKIYTYQIQWNVRVNVHYNINIISEIFA